MYKRPDVNLLTSYTKGLEGWADHVVPPAVARTAYAGPSLTGRAPVAWVRRHKLQLMQKQQYHKQQNHKVYLHQHYNNVGNHFLW